MFDVVRNMLYLFPLECFIGMEGELVTLLRAYPSLIEETMENEIRRLMGFVEERDGIVSVDSLKRVYLRRMDATRDGILLSVFAKNPTVLTQVGVERVREG